MFARARSAIFGEAKCFQTSKALWTKVVPSACGSGEAAILIVVVPNCCRIDGRDSDAIARADVDRGARVLHIASGAPRRCIGSELPARHAMNALARAKRIEIADARRTRRLA